MSRLRSICIASALSVAFNTSAAGAFEVTPFGLLEGDYQLHHNDVEGYDGFSLSRARAGVIGSPWPWLEVHLLGEWAREKVSLVDAYAQINIGQQFAISAGYSRNSLFITGRDNLDPYFAIPERSITAQALWPGRDLGIEAHWFPRAPIESWLRVENGGTSVLGNDNNPPAFTVRTDIVMGRASVRSTGQELVGLRVGGGMYFDWAPDRLSVTGATPTGFVFYRPSTVSGFRTIVEWHALLQAGPFQALFEAGVAREERSRNVTGNPNMPRQALDPVVSAGGSLELSWMLTGERRLSGHWTMPRRPLGPGWGPGAWELAARVERVLLGEGPPELTPGGVIAGALALHWWVNQYSAFAVAAYINHYDVPPLEEPTTSLGWTILMRATVRIE